MQLGLGFTETDSTLIKVKRERFSKRRTGCLKRFAKEKLIHRSIYR